MAKYEIIVGVAILPEGIKMIEDYAFWNCEELERVVIPQWVRRIGNQAFYGCENLEVVELPEWLEDIGMDAFFWLFFLKRTDFAPMGEAD